MIHWISCVDMRSRGDKSRSLNTLVPFHGIRAPANIYVTGGHSAFRRFAMKEYIVVVAGFSVNFVPLPAQLT
jgi:hypothetical protein